MLLRVVGATRPSHRLRTTLLMSPNRFPCVIYTPVLVFGPGTEVSGPTTGNPMGGQRRVRRVTENLYLSKDLYVGPPS